MLVLELVLLFSLCCCEPQRDILPLSIKPSHYDIHLFNLQFEPQLFSGTEKTKLHITSPTDSIHMNALDIQITKAILSAGVGSITFREDQILYDEEHELVLLKSDHLLPLGEALLEVHFNGKINSQLFGFYRSKWVKDGVTHWIGTTQFQPADARRAFPCWDEPALKATFSMKITTEQDNNVLSNMEPQETIFHNCPDSDKQCQTVQFHPSPLMSSYLVAYTIGKFSFIEGVSEQGTIVRVWSVPDKIHLGHFSLDIGIKFLNFFETYFNIPYPLSKLDMIAVPDFNALAMENWGLIIYRENALLCDYNSSLATKYLVSFVVAHEIAHQWFGNLVTMEWWKELWLNEGFANFVATQALDHYFPEWNMWEQFATKYIFEGMKIDSMRNSHPIEVPISKARAVVEIFDMISYNKGASVIRMLENYLGDNFRIGLSNYLSKFKYQNTVTEDLWDSLSNVCGKNIREIMGPWSTFQGFPVVHVCESEKEGLYEIAQKRFLKYGEPTPQEDEPLWYINLAYISDTTRKVQYIDITHKHNLVEIPHSSGWLKLNAGQSGFYRVQYCEKSFGKLLGAIHELPMIDQLGIQNDAVSLAISGNLPVEWALQVLLDLRASPEPILWIDIDQNVQQLSQLFSGTPAETYFSRFLCHLYENINQKVGWEPKPGELELVKMLRPKVLYTLGNHGDNQILNEAKKRFEEYLVDLSSQSMDILPTIFKLVMRNGGDVEYDTLLSIYNTTKIPEKRLAALISLSYSRRPDIIKRALEFSLSSWVSPQDAYYFFQGSTSTMEGQTIAWKFMKDNWEKIIEKIGQNFLLGRTVTLGTTLLKTEDMAQEVENFFLTRRTPAFERSLNQALETIRGADNFISKNLKSVFGWLRLTFPDPLDPLRTYAAAEGLRYREETGRD